MCKPALRPLHTGDWGLRDYGAEGQLGLEKTPDEYISKMVDVFREVRRVLRSDGTLWMNMGDSYSSGDRATWRSGASENKGQNVQNDMPRPAQPPGMKPKDLVGMPWMLAFALRADGWWLRQDIIWSKPNPMPESVTDRCTKAHEYLFLLSKSARYYYDQEAIREMAIGDNDHDLTGQSYEAPGQTRQTGSRKIKMPDGWDTGAGGHGSYHRQGREKGKTRLTTDHCPLTTVSAGRASGNKTHKLVTKYEQDSESASQQVSQLPEQHRTAAGLLKIAETPYPMRNKRSVWEIATQPFAEAHFATYPEKLVEPCILAGTSEYGCCPQCGAPWRRCLSSGADSNPGSDSFDERAAAARKHREISAGYQVRLEKQDGNTGLATDV